MKVLFLDFDGVLNTEKYVKNCGYFGVVIDPEKLANLRRIVDETGSKIVITTSWREHWGEPSHDQTGDEIDRIFKTAGLEVFDKTKAFGSREEEIERWLGENKNVLRFAAIDDMVLEAPFLKGRFIKTSSHRGLDEQATVKAIEILNGVD